jgi:20S proteasome alpha/beta subunit
LTLALAICCRDGIVFAADSQSTLLTPGQYTRQDTEKLYVLGDRIAWAGAGTVGAIQRVEHVLTHHAGDVVRAFAQGHELGARKIHARVSAVQREIAAEILGDPTEEGTSAYLFGGYGAAGQFLLEIDSSGVRQWCERSHFTAIGSGAIYAVHAYRSIAHYRLPSLSLVQAQALAYRTVENAIATAALGLGGAIRLATVTSDGACALGDVDIKAVQDTVDIWKQREVEILAELDPAAEEAPAPAAGLDEPPRE